MFARWPGFDDKSLQDFAFILYYIIFWSFVRQTLIFYLLQPLARHYGIKSQAKLDRFGEQGYAIVYNVIMGSTAVVCLFLDSHGFHLPDSHIVCNVSAPNLVLSHRVFLVK